jgi:probable HAF family extracellular repeat protein
VSEEVAAMGTGWNVPTSSGGRGRRLLLITGVSATLGVVSGPGVAMAAQPGRPAAIQVGPAADLAQTTPVVTQRGRLTAPSGRELPAGPLTALRAINDAGVVAGTNAAEHATTWDSRTGRVRDLGMLPESYSSWPTAINDRGAVVGSSCAPIEASYGCHAFIWTASRGLTDLGTFGGAFSGAAAINDRGVVVGHAETAARAGATPEARAFVWTPQSGLRSLGVLPGMTGSAATDVNNAGTVVGYSSRLVTGPSDTTSITQAFMWTPRQGLHELGGFGGTDTKAWAINDHGVVAGTSTTADGVQHLFTWTTRSGMVDRGVLGTRGEVIGITNSGVIVGDRELPGTPQRAFVYTPRSGLHDLGLPAAAIGSSFPYGMNDHGTIVGDLSDDGGMNLPYRTFIYQLTLRH